MTKPAITICPTMPCEGYQGQMQDEFYNDLYQACTSGLGSNKPMKFLPKIESNTRGGQKRQGKIKQRTEI